MSGNWFICFFYAYFVAYFHSMILIKSKHKEFMPFKESRDLILTISHPKDKNKMAKSGHI